VLAHPGFGRADFVRQILAEALETGIEDVHRLILSWLTTRLSIVSVGGHLSHHHQPAVDVEGGAGNVGGGV
jgi:hypothetical protein